MKSKCKIYLNTIKINMVSELTMVIMLLHLSR
nr:MAG TPA: hypothetical protein [Caudoviricetes sp.]